MADGMITYETLYEVLRREKYRADIQKVNEQFYQDVVKYLQEKKAILETQSKKDSIFASTEAEKTQTQLKNVQKILRELYEKRENKIVQFALFSSRSNTPQDTSTMLPEEYALYMAVKSVLDQYRNGILVNILQEKVPVVDLYEEQKDLKSEEETGSLAITITTDVPQFVGPDMEVYGPLRAGETYTLPKEIVTLLLNMKQTKNENLQKDSETLSQV